MVGSRLSPAHKLLIVFVLTVFAPGALLAVFGARALWGERRIAENELRGRLDRGGQAAIRVLSDELAKLLALLDQPVRDDRLLRRLGANGSWVYVDRQPDGRWVVLPRDVLPYDLGPPIDRFPSPVSVLDAKHREARTLRQAGQIAGAAQLWRQIERSNGTIRSMPADLVAGFELATLDCCEAAKAFQQKLRSGRWRLEKPRYLHYLSEIEKHLRVTLGADQRLQLAEAVEALSAASSSRFVKRGNESYIALRHDAALPVLVLSGDFIRAQIWSQLEAAPDSDLRVTSLTVNSAVVHALPGTAATLQAAPLFDSSGLAWKVVVEPRDPSGFYSAVHRRTNLYLAMLLLVVALLASGGYLVARTVRRELEVARMKSEFVSTVSHEFRSPLTGIRQLGELLARDRVTDEARRHQYYELIVHESERLHRLVENVLDSSRMEAGRKQYCFEPLNSVAWLRDLAADFNFEAARRGYELQTQIPPDLPTISGDREALTTAVRNLLDNACKYSPETKSVWLDAEAVEGGVRVRVRDRGIGIPAGEQRHIFDRFYRGAHSSHRARGVGLGLSLVQHVVAAHRGEVQMESREGEGSTFCIVLRGTS
jgi:signal transduction histidine kinase